MTVSGVATEVSYTGDASVTSFTVTFPFFGTGSTSELEVVSRVISSGEETTQTYSTHYTVTGGSGSTGTVTAATAPAATVEWHIRRLTTQTQGTDYVENDEFPADSHEDALDRLTAINQEQKTELDKTFQYPVTYTGSGTTVVPEPSARKALVWNSGGTALVNSVSDPDTAAAAAASSAAAALVSENAAAADVVLTNADVVQSQNWATKTDGIVDATDYASKAWSIGGTGVTDTAGKGAAKEWATEVEDNTVNGSGYSALHHSAKAAAQASAAAASATASAASAASNLFSKVSAKATADSPYTVVSDTDDGTLFVITMDGNVQFTLPDIDTAGEGERYGILRSGASNALTLVRNGTDTINGVAGTYTVEALDGTLILIVADDASPDNWIVIPWTQAKSGTGLSQAGSVISLDLTSDQAWTGSQRATTVALTDGTLLDMNTAQDWDWTPAAADVLSFANITNGQRGMILLNNPSAHAITKAAAVHCDADFLTTVSAAGVYACWYWTDASGSIVYVGGSPALAT
tara:strand:+ start:17077 stop:18642 length:1566 start_codon:yes stop_codon:yes gene_type:complete